MLRYAPSPYRLTYQRPPLNSLPNQSAQIELRAARSHPQIDAAPNIFFFNLDRYGVNASWRTCQKKWHLMSSARK
jgi:hypothetical protein